jgi:hypothetical protein
MRANELGAKSERSDGTWHQNDKLPIWRVCRFAWGEVTALFDGSKVIISELNSALGRPASQHAQSLRNHG